MPESRQDTARAFADAKGWAHCPMTLIAGDASNRKYYRLRDGDDSALLMDAPPDKGEDTGPFINIAQYLNGSGLSAPRILEADTKAGFLLIEDFGDALFARLLEQGAADETMLYNAATDVLLHLHRQRPPQLAAYDAPLMADISALSVTWYRRGALNIEDPRLIDEMRAQMHALLHPLDATPRVLIQRDYHAENLLWLPERMGVRRVGLLDFQDAMLGHPAYDLVSVLQDARRDVPPAVADAMCARYLAGSKLDKPKFMQAYYTLGLQRNLRILGVFARLCLRDAKPHYLDLIPRVWAHVTDSLDRLNDPSLTAFITQTLPEPTPETLEKIRSLCPTPQPQP